MSDWIAQNYFSSHRSQRWMGNGVEFDFSLFIASDLECEGEHIGNDGFVQYAHTRSIISYLFEMVTFIFPLLRRNTHTQIQNSMMIAFVGDCRCCLSWGWPNATKYDIISILFIHGIFWWWCEHCIMRNFLVDLVVHLHSINSNSSSRSSGKDNIYAQ